MYIMKDHPFTLHQKDLFTNNVKKLFSRNLQSDQSPRFFQDDIFDREKWGNDRGT